MTGICGEDVGSTPFLVAVPEQEVAQYLILPRNLPTYNVDTITIPSQTSLAF